MKTYPRPTRSSSARVFTALLASFVILVTPVTPLASASSPSAGTRAGRYSPAGAFDPPTAIVKATKTDSFADPDGDGKAEPGATITYDVNVSNTGAADATGVAFTDTIDPNTTLVSGSLRVSPLAFADSYSASKDTALSVPAPGVLVNDTGTPQPSAQPIAGGATSQGGSVTLNADGSFNYTPPAGFEGADTFTYTATNGTTPNDTATVTINVDAGPTVASTSPVNGATNVAQNSNITVNFSEPVNATNASFSLQCPTGSPQAFTLLNASPSSSFTLDPTADLPAGTTCTVTVFGNQITDADNFDPPDQMAGDYTFSFGVKPLAVDDMHSVTGNVRINTSASGYSVLANDQAPGATITAFDATSAHGGNVVMNTSTGTFTYDPPRGFTGTDSFNYTISNSAGSDQGTVVLTVTDMIWFINNAPGACSSGCDGRLTHPFASLADFEAVNGNGTVSGGAVVDPEDGDDIFIYTGGGNYTGPVTLENNQRLIGQGATSSITALTLIMPPMDSDPLPATGGANPVITAGGNGINLAQNDSIYGLSVVNTTGTGIGGNGFGTLTVAENVVVSNTTTAGTPVSLNNGVLAATFKSISAGNNDANPDPVNGIVLSNTTGSFTVSGDGAQTGGLYDRNGSGGTIQHTSGHGVSLTNASGVTLRQMNITDTAAGGSCPSACASNAVDSSGGGNIVLSAVLLKNLGGDGWNATNITGANSFDNNGRVESWQTLNANGIHVANNNTNFTSFTVANSLFTTSATGNQGLLFEANGTTTGGTVSVASSEFTLIDQNAVQINNNGSGTLTAFVQKSNFHDANPTTGNNTLYLTNDGGGQLNFTVGGPSASDGNTFNNLGRLVVLAGVVQVDAATVSKTGTKLNGSIQNNTITNSTGRRAIDVQIESNASTHGGHSILIANNTASNIRKQGVSVTWTSVAGGDAQNNNFSVKNNTFTNVGTEGATDSGSAIELETNVDAANTGADLGANILVESNSAQNNNSSAVGTTFEVNNRAVGGNNTSAINLTARGNTFTNNSASTSSETFEVLNVAGDGTAQPSTCVDLDADGTAPNNSVGNTATHFKLTNNATGTFSIEGLGANTPSAFLGPRNQKNGTTPATITANGTFVSSAGCADSTASVRFFGETETAPLVAAASATSQTDSSSAMASDAGQPREWSDIPAGRRASASGEAAASYANRVNQSFYGARFVRSSYERPDYARVMVPVGDAVAESNAGARHEGAANAATTASALTATAFSGETVSANVGTLQSGKTVHITFQVTVNDPLPAGTSQVSNQGTISGDNFSPVLTDDPAAGGSSDPTVTPILTPPDITVKDATVNEPATGSNSAAFAVTLSHSFTHPVSINFATADDTGGANPATAGSDYTPTSGTLTFNPGEVVKTVSVPVLADADATETNETFLVNISGATGGATITRAQATGTITPDSTPGTVVISELRTSGPAGAGDDFVELLNNTGSDITVQASDSSAGWALVKSGNDCSSTPVVVAVIPNGAVIPAHGNYLIVGSTYSLGAYAAGDQTLSSDIEDDHNVALFNTADLSNISTGTRLDAVGFGSNSGGNCDLLREGTTLQPAAGSTSEYSFVRKVDKGSTQDTNDNSADFIVVSTTPATPVGSNATPTLGAPGPENSTGPRGPIACSDPGAAKFGRSLLDSTVGAASAPNIVHDATSDPVNNSTFGTIDFRRRFTNNTGGAVTALRFRITNTTNPATPGKADLRARSSSATVVAGVNDAATCGGSAPCSVVVQGTTLEQPPAQASGGGVNSSLGVGSITFATPLAPGASVDLHLLFGVQQQGDYHVSIVVEAATNGQIGQDEWELRGNTQTGGDTDGGCNTPPVANAGPDQTIECGGATSPVTLDGTGSTDADGDALTYEWREGANVLGTTAVLNTSLAFGPHTITLKVTDPSGDFSEDTVNVNIVDTTDPVITAPPNVSVNTGPGSTTCGAFVSDATLGAASASDGCSTNVTITRTGVPSGNVFPVGTTVVTYTADDGHGHTANAYQSVTVTDDTPPTISAPANITTDAPANSCSANVNPGTASASDNCSGTTVAGARSDSQPLNAPYPVGTTTITWTATDAHGNQATATQTVTVKDVTPPVITLTAGVINLSPPNHQYVTFSMSDLVASASDGCDASVNINKVMISKVTSDEAEDAVGAGDGNTLNDIVIAPDCKSLQLRSERAGNGDGRVYTITLSVKDSSGNVATAVRKVFVPNSGPAIDSGPHYTVNGCNP